MSENSFCIVWNPAGSNPQYRHTTPDAATTEARRLAAQSPGQKFYVLQALSVSTHDAVRTVQLHHDDDLPF